MLLTSQTRRARGKSGAFSLFLFALGGVGISAFGNATLYQSFEGPTLLERAAAAFVGAALTAWAAGRKLTGENLPFALTLALAFELTAMLVIRVLLGDHQFFDMPVVLGSGPPGRSGVLSSTLLFVGAAVVGVFLAPPSILSRRTTREPQGLAGLLVCVGCSAAVVAGTGYLLGFAADPMGWNMVQAGGAIIGFVVGCLLGFPLWLARS